MPDSKAPPETTDIVSLEQQWLGLCQSIGSWEGNQATYDADGTLQKRQPCMLFIYIDSKESPEKLASGAPPDSIRMRLHRTRDRTEGREQFLRRTSPLLRYSAFEPFSGAMSAGPGVLGAVPVLEFALNARDSSDGPVTRRVRTVTSFSAEHLRHIVIFRERRTDTRWHVEKPHVSADVADSDYVASGVEVSPRALEGVWKVTATVVDAGDGDGGGSGRFRKGSVTRRVVGDGRRLELVEDGQVCVGEVSPNGRVMTVTGDADAVGVRRVVFLGGGVTVTTSVSAGGGELFVEMGWLLRAGVRLAVVRRYVGGRWTGAEFVRETRES